MDTDHSGTLTLEKMKHLVSDPSMESALRHWMDEFGHERHHNLRYNDFLLFVASLQDDAYNATPWKHKEVARNWQRHRHYTVD